MHSSSFQQNDLAPYYTSEQGWRHSHGKRVWAKKSDTVVRTVLVNGKPEKMSLLLRF